MAGFALANGSLSSNTSADAARRTAPGGGVGERPFIGARKLGTMRTPVLRTLSGIEQSECVHGTGDPLPAEAAI